MDREQLIANIYENMHAVRKGMFHRLQQAVTDVTASPAQLHLLFMIKHYQPINAKQLALKLQMTAGAVSQLIDGLQSQDLIQRTPDPADRRIQTLELTGKGERSFAAIEDQRRKTMETVMQTLTDKELTTWLRVQQKMLEAFDTTNIRKGD